MIHSLTEYLKTIAITKFMLSKVMYSKFLQHMVEKVALLRCTMITFQENLIQLVFQLIKRMTGLVKRLASI